MPYTSTRMAILQTLLTRLSAITQVGGYLTDAGDQVYLGEAPALGPDDPDAAIAILVGDEDPNWQGSGRACVIKLPLTLQAVAKTEIDGAWLMVEALLADAKRAIETADVDLGGLLTGPLARGPVTTLPRETGSLTVGASVGYTATFKEGWGTP